MGAIDAGSELDRDVVAGGERLQADAVIATVSVAPLLAMLALVPLAARSAYGPWRVEPRRAR